MFCVRRNCFQPAIWHSETALGGNEPDCAICFDRFGEPIGRNNQNGYFLIISAEGFRQSFKDGRMVPPTVMGRTLPDGIDVPKRLY